VGFSYGFRPGRDPHQALDALYVGLTERPIHWMVDLDIQSYIDRIQHEWVMRILQNHIADKRIIRLIRKWLRAGVMEDGRWQATEEGSPQGAAYWRISICTMPLICGCSSSAARPCEAPWSW
jgi:RNA-directed DNA polymerase